MKHIFLYCTISAVLGGAVAISLVDGDTLWSTSRAALAQETRSGPDPALLAMAAVPPNTTLTPEEITNIRVYEGANRGVVNVVTRTINYDGFFMLPTPGEGAGSGCVLDKRGHILTNYHV